ncbi:VQ domain-containing protein [Dioscorea alata]|uniref:VQ domain-containing protein n=1 Tax=Dioscorea alata TaxID=55571 RepID=A0ACB7TSP8_DIOAL|nr:VQ domain-containing protein [Dioscorea alata]
MSGESSKAVTVKIIETQFVQTDAEQFKSVVQRLTGKSSSSLACERTKMVNDKERGTALMVESNKVKAEDVEGLKYMELSSLEDLCKFLRD